VKPATPLDELEVLLVDCQATGANPRSGVPLEIGWSTFTAGTDRDPRSVEHSTRLLRLPEGAELTPRVSAVTGISAADLDASVEPSSAWAELAAAARDTARENRLEICPTVIHFARYETPFLELLHERHGGETPFPLEIFCTHELIKRLDPGLPRKGLRAVAGYFGLTVPGERRCGCHLTATAWIWREVVRLLDRREGVRSLEELRHRLSLPAAAGRVARTYPLDRRLRLALPDRPGVYRLLRSNGDILYIGKARSLRKRVNSYFQTGRRHNDRILEMLTQARDIDTTTTGSGLEAAVLESDEIKRHAPPYNLSLREGTRSICFSSGDFSHVDPSPCRRCCEGPFPLDGAPRALGTIGRLLGEHAAGRRGAAAAGRLPPQTAAGDAEKETIALALGMPPSLVPEARVFHDGFSLFRELHPALCSEARPAVRLMRLGRELWDEMLARPETEKPNREEEEGDEDGGGEETGLTWTPDAVGRVLESSIRNASHAVRRGRWFCILSQASLAWEREGGGSGQMNLIVFRDAGVWKRGVIGPGERIPSPPGFRKRHRERLGSFDLSAYDRMRVVTTEMRRILAEGRRVALRLGPGALLDGEQLARLLLWV
jgi:DNA polymerase-3 subunit epsilon